MTIPAQASYLRAATVTVGPATGGSGRSFVSAPQPPQLSRRISFDIEKDLSPEPNSATIQLYNLSPDSREFLEAPDQVITVEAGYGSSPQLRLFQGDVERVEHVHQPPDWITTIEAEDGSRRWRDARVNVSRPPGVTVQSVLNDLGSALELPVEIHLDSEAAVLAARQFVSGWAFSGPARHALRQLADVLGQTVSIQGGVLLITPDEGVSGVAPLVNPGTGLIGAPQRAKIEVSNRRRRGRGGGGAGGRRERDGVKVRVLLNTLLDPGSRFRLESARIEGTFCVQRVRYQGDSGWSQEWWSDAEAIAV